MTFGRTSFLGLLLAMAAQPADSGLRHPVTGYVLDERTGQIRPINGLPGAALLGTPMETAESFEQVWFAPGQKNALARGKSGNAYQLSFTYHSMVAVPLLLDLRAAHVGFDRSGNGAIVCSAARSTCRVLSNLAEGVKASEEVSTGALPGTLQTVALSPNGQELAATVLSSGRTAVYTISLKAGNDSAVRFVTDLQSDGAVEYGPSGNDLLLTDPLGHRVLLARRLSERWDVTVLANGNDGISHPISAFYRDNGTLVVVNESAKEVWLLTPDAVDIRKLALPETADRLLPMSAPEVLLLTPVADGPVSLLDLSAEGRVVFVPAAGPSEAVR